MTRRIEAWTLPDDPGGFRRVANVPILQASTNDPADTIGTGSVTIPFTWSRRSLILEADPTDPGGGPQTLLSLWRDGATAPDFEWFAEEANRTVDDAGRVGWEVTGRCIRSALDHAVVYPDPATGLDWIWGGGDMLPARGLSDLASFRAEWAIWLSGGTDTDEWTITVPAGTTDTMPKNAGWHVVEARLQALSGIDDVSVSGSGTEEDPWRVTFVRPATVNSLSVSFPAGTPNVDQVQAGVPDPGPFTRSQRIDERDTSANSDHGTYSDPAVEVDTTTVNTGSDWSLAVHATGQYGGSQIVLAVTPGQLAQVRIPIRSQHAGLFRAIVRDPWGNLIKASTPFEVPVDADTWTVLEIADVSIPPGIDRVIVRVAIVDSDPDTWDTFWVDWEGATVNEGRSPATVGRIMLDLLREVQARGGLTWLTVGFDESVDSAAVAWDTSLSFRADVRSSYGTHVAGDLSTLGYEWDIVRLAEPGPDGETHELLWWNPGGRAPEIDGAAFVEGANLPAGGVIQERAPDRTHLLVQDDTGAVDTVTIDALSGRSRREGAILLEWAPDLVTARAAAEAALTDDLGNLFAVQVRLTAQQEPYERFDVGSTVPVLVGGVLHDRRVSTISLRFDGSGWQREVTCSRVFAATGDGQLTALYEAVRRLYAEFARRRRPRPSLPQVGGGTGGMATLLAMPQGHPQAHKADLVAGGADDLQAATLQQGIEEIQLGGSGTLWVHDIIALSAAVPVTVWPGVEMRGVARRTRLRRPDDDSEVLVVSGSGVLRDVELWRRVT